MKIKIKCYGCNHEFTTTNEENNWICPKCRGNNTWTIDIIHDEPLTPLVINGMGGRSQK